MAAPSWNLVLHCRHIFKPRLAYGVANFQNLPICRFSTSGNLSKKQIHVFSARKFEKMMTKKKFYKAVFEDLFNIVGPALERRTLRKKFYFDPMNTSQLGKMTGSNLISKKAVNKLGQKDSVKLRVYNTILYEHIVDLVNSNYISDELEQLELPILSVRMAGDMSVARVYWQASGNAESDDKVQTVLDKYTGRVRHALISLRVLGNVPRVCFLKDKAAANIAEIDHLLATADYGPSDDESLTEEDPHGVEWKNSHDEDVLHWQGGSTIKRGDKHDKEPEGHDNGSKYKGPNYFAVDHADALSQIVSHKSKQESLKVPDGFSPIADSIEKFKVFQKKKKIKRKIQEDDIMYRGQLEMASITREEDFEAKDFDDGLDNLEESSDFESTNDGSSGKPTEI